MDREVNENNELRKYKEEIRKKYDNLYCEYNLLIYKNQEKEEQLKKDLLRTRTENETEKENYKKFHQENDKETQKNVNSFQNNQQNKDNYENLFKEDVRNLIRFIETNDFKASPLFNINSNESCLQDLKNSIVFCLKKKRELTKENKSINKMREKLTKKFDEIQKVENSEQKKKNIENEKQIEELFRLVK